MNAFDFIPNETKPLDFERHFWESGTQYVAGIDEVGRGALAGPVVACALVLPANTQPLPGVKDSKRLSPSQREALFPLILEQATAVGIGQVAPEKIDEINILEATRTAMALAVEELNPPPEMCLVDGNQKIVVPCPQRMIIKGDQRVYSISAASIVAKVTRDRWMVEQSQIYPTFGFDQHKGYGTKIHRNAILKHGPSPIHRRSFLRNIQRMS